MPRRGFTLIELTLSIALVGALFAVAMPVARPAMSRGALSDASVAVSSQLRRAQILARGSDGAGAWGVRVEPEAARLFFGESYAARDASFDEDAPLSGQVSASGTIEFVFQETTGNPVATGDLTLSVGEGPDVIIHVNEKGSISF